jgi:hypothetical protein
LEDGSIPETDIEEKLMKKAPSKKSKSSKDDYASSIINGVEVVDVKAIPAPLDKFGIPVPKSRKTWDRI